MRAGRYALWRGEEYKAHRVDKDWVLLVRPSDQPQPEGFTEDSGEWVRKVRGTELSKVFSVRTVAVWQGHRVTVWSVDGDIAQVEASSTTQEGIPDHPAAVRENAYGDWSARVPVWELTEVVETVVDARL